MSDRVPTKKTGGQRARNAKDRLRKIKGNHEKAQKLGEEIKYYLIPDYIDSLPFKFRVAQFPDLGLMTVGKIYDCDRWICSLKVVINGVKFSLTPKNMVRVSHGNFLYEFDVIRRSKGVIISISKSIKFPTENPIIDENILLHMPYAKQKQWCGESDYLQSLCREEFWKTLLTSYIKKKYNRDIKFPKITGIKYRKLYSSIKENKNGGLWILDEPTIESLLDAGIDLPLDDILIESVKNESESKVRFLVSKGADINAKEGMPLFVAVSQDHIDILILLLKLGVDVKAGDSNCLIGAVSNIRPVSAEEYDYDRWVDSEESLDQSNDYGYDYYNALVQAIEYRAQTISQLLSLGADTNAQDRKALKIAIDYGYINLVDAFADGIPIDEIRSLARERGQVKLASKL